MLRSKYYFALTVAVATGLPVDFSKVASAQTGYAGPYGGVLPNSWWTQHGPAPVREKIFFKIG